MNCRHKIYLLLVILCGITQNLVAQDYQIYQYRAADGLRTDMIKSINQDTLGFVWIGTDNGLVRYNGSAFTPYINELGSNYIKDLLKTSQGKLLAIHDLGVVEIKNLIDTVVFKPVLKGANLLTDTALWYPKSAYEDRYGNIWISEPQSIVRLQLDPLQWKRFKFGPEANSSSFVRSFNFLELSGDSMLLSAFPGQFFLYDHKIKDITSLKFSEADHEIYTLEKVGSKYFAGTNRGLYQLQFDYNSIQFGPAILDVLITDIAPVNDSGFIACSENTFNYLVTYQQDNYATQPLERTKLNTNEAYISESGNIWLSTQKGVELLKKPNFKPVELDVPNMFVEAIISHPESSFLYMLGKEAIWRINKKSEQSERILERKGGYFLSASATKKGLWVSNAFELMYIEQGEVKDQVDFRQYGRFIFNIHRDNAGNIWIGQEAANGIKRYNVHNKQIEVFDQENGLNNQITTITESETGLYVSILDNEDYLFYKPEESDNFINISHPYKSEFGSFYIEDLKILDEDIYMGTNMGLFRHSKDTLEKITFNSALESSIIRSIAIDSPFIWFGNQLGLYRYNVKTGMYNLFNEDTGLPANTVNQEGLLITENKIWVGTPFGLSVMPYENRVYNKTKSPVILKILVNGKERKHLNSELILQHNPYLEFFYTALSFPASEIQYSYRIPEFNSQWSMPKFDNKAVFTDLPTGNYTFEVRAKKLGNNQWSETERIGFIVEPSFYNTWKFYLLIGFIVLLFALFTRNVTRYFMRQRQRILEKMVEERTVELERHKNKLEHMVQERTSDLNAVNKELTATNDELYAKNDTISEQKSKLEQTIQNLKETQTKLIEAEKMASLGVLTAGISHEINNPLNFIMGGTTGLENYFQEHPELSKEEIEVYLRSIRTGLDRASDIVQGLNQFNRESATYNEVCELHKIIDNVLLMLNKQFLGKITIQKNYTNDFFNLKGNVGKIHQVLINVLMNAAQSIKNKGTIHISTELDNSSIVLKITDTGLGIPKSNIHRITEPFFTTKEPGEGTGLGLSIAYRIIKDHQGNLQFKSDEGKGTTVIITFPIER